METPVVRAPAEAPSPTFVTSPEERRALTEARTVREKLSHQVKHMQRVLAAPHASSPERGDADTPAAEDEKAGKIAFEEA